MRLTADELVDFLTYLRSDLDFSIGVREMLRAERVRSFLCERAQPPDLDGWAMHIAPVICGSAEEQRKLGIALGEYKDQISRRTPTLPDTPEIAPLPHERSRSLFVRLKRWLVPLAVLAALAVALPLAPDSWKTTVSKVIFIRTEGPGPLLEPPQFEMLQVSLDTATLMILPWLLLLTFVVWRSDRRLSFYRRLRVGAGLRQTYQFGTPRSDYMQTARFARYVQAFQLRLPKGPPFFAAETTVRTASARAGFAEPQLRRRTSRPSYLMLISQRGRGDHISALAIEFLALLKSASVAVEAFTYVGYPSQLMPFDAGGLSPEIGTLVALEDALADTPDSITLLIDDGTGLLDPASFEVTSEAASILWGTHLAIVLSPTVTVQWAWRERALDEAGFIVVPFDPAGLVDLCRVLSDLERTDVARVDPLVYAVERPVGQTGAYPLLLRLGADRYLSDTRPPAHAVAALLDELKQYLGRAGFLWLSTLAAYPTLQSDLTREIGFRISRLLDRRIFSPQTYLALARLPWVVQGKMPDWLRRSLLQSVSPEVASAIRQALDSLLSEATRRGATALEINPPMSVWRRIKALKFFLSNARVRFSHDSVFLQFMAAGKRTLFMPAPQWLQRMFKPKIANRIVSVLAIVVCAIGSGAALLVPRSQLGETLGVIELTSTMGVGVWHIFRVHFANDSLSRSGVLFSLIAAATLTIGASGLVQLREKVLLIGVLLLNAAVRHFLQEKHLEDHTDTITQRAAYDLGHPFVPALGYLITVFIILPGPVSRFLWALDPSSPQLKWPTGFFLGFLLAHAVGYLVLALAVARSSSLAITIWAMLAAWTSATTISVSASFWGPLMIGGNYFRDLTSVVDVSLISVAYVVFAVTSAFFLLRRIGVALPVRSSVIMLFMSTMLIIWLLREKPTDETLILWLSPFVHLPIIVTELMASSGLRPPYMRVLILSAFAPLWFFGIGDGDRVIIAGIHTAVVLYGMISALLMCLFAWRISRDRDARIDWNTKSPGRLSSKAAFRMVPSEVWRSGQTAPSK
jgi:hypothetical protein